MTDVSLPLAEDVKEQTQEEVDEGTAADAKFLKDVESYFDEGSGVSLSLPPRRPAECSKKAVKRSSWIAMGNMLLSVSSEEHVALVGDFAQDRRFASIPLVPVALVSGGAYGNDPSRSFRMLQEHLESRFPETHVVIALPLRGSNGGKLDRAHTRPAYLAELFLTRVCQSLKLNLPEGSVLALKSTGHHTLDALEAYMSGLDCPQPLVVYIHGVENAENFQAMFSELLSLCLIQRTRVTDVRSSPDGQTRSTQTRIAKKPLHIVFVIRTASPTTAERVIGFSAASMAVTRCFTLVDTEATMGRLLSRVLIQWSFICPVCGGCSYVIHTADGCGGKVCSMCRGPCSSCGKTGDTIKDEDIGRPFEYVAPHALYYALDQRVLADSSVLSFCRVLDIAVQEQQRNEWKHDLLGFGRDGCERLKPSDFTAMSLFAVLFRCLTLLYDAYSHSVSTSSSLPSETLTSTYRLMPKLIRSFLGYETELDVPYDEAVALAEKSPRERAERNDPLALAWLKTESLDIDYALLPTIDNMRSYLLLLPEQLGILDRWRDSIKSASEEFRARKALDNQNLAFLINSFRRTKEEIQLAKTALMKPFFLLFRPLVELCHQDFSSDDEDDPEQRWTDILEPGGLAYTVKYASGESVSQQLAEELLKPSYPCKEGTEEHHLQEQTSLSFRALLSMVHYFRQSQSRHEQDQQQRNVPARHRTGEASLAEWAEAFGLLPGSDKTFFGATVQLLSQHGIVIPKPHYPDTILLNFAV